MVESIQIKSDIDANAKWYCSASPCIYVNTNVDVEWIILLPWSLILFPPFAALNLCRRQHRCKAIQSRSRRCWFLASTSMLTQMQSSATLLYIAQHLHTQMQNSAHPSSPFCCSVSTLTPMHMQGDAEQKGRCWHSTFVSTSLEIYVNINTNAKQHHYTLHHPTSMLAPTQMQSGAYPSSPLPRSLVLLSFIVLHLYRCHLTFVSVLT